MSAWAKGSVQMRCSYTASAIYRYICYTVCSLSLYPRSTVLSRRLQLYRFNTIVSRTGGVICYMATVWALGAPNRTRARCTVLRYATTVSRDFHGVILIANRYVTMFLPSGAGAGGLARLAPPARLCSTIAPRLASVHTPQSRLSRTSGGGKVVSGQVELQLYTGIGR